MELAATCETLHDHFVAHPYPPGTRKYAWHLTWADDAPLRSAATRLAAPLAGIDGLRLIPEPWLHMTLGGLGPVAGVPDERLAAERDRVRAATAGLALTVTFPRLLVVDEGVLLAADPTPELVGLGETVLPGRERPLWPHVSLAYATGDVDAGRVMEALREAAAAEAPLVAERPRLTLMRIGRDTGQYTWDVLDERPVGRG